MNISILTVFPELYDSFLKTSLIGRAQEKNIVSFDITPFFSYVAPKERIDAPTFGHGAGMLIKPAVIEKAIDDKEQRYGKALKIFFSPQGKKLTQPLLNELAQKIQQSDHVMLVASRYEGMDARVEQVYADEIISIGDYVLLGGDLPAMVFLEGLIRLLPGVVGKKSSLEHESFMGPFVDYPEYTEPVIWHDKHVPEVVRSGNHQAIAQWRKQQAAQKTVLEHFDWLRSSKLSEQDVELASSYIPAHYCALLHSDVLIGPQERKPGTTSVTSVDMHDIARSSATYGLKGYFIVTPLYDQQKIVNTLLNFWQKGIGVDYNPVRHEAVNRVQVQESLDAAIEQIKKIGGKEPLLIGTSARYSDHPGAITFADQKKVWVLGRPILFIFGTGQGITPETLARCDFLLPPVEGFSDFNHLSVRTAVGIILDRWLGR